MNKWYFTFTAALLLGTVSGTLQAQEESTGSSGTKIIIIEEKVDGHGNKTVTKTIKEGDFTDEEVEKIIAEESHTGKHEASQEDKGYLGVMIENADGGVRITEVVEGSPAEACGLKSGDVIIAVDNFEVSNMEALVDAISSHKAGETVQVHYLRDGVSTTAPVKLAEREETVFPNGFEWDEHVRDNSKPSMEAEEFRKTKSYDDAEKLHDKMMKEHGKDMDVVIEKSKPRFGVYLEEVEDGAGVLVTKVTEGSVAERSGMQSGDIITSFNGTEVNSSEDLIEAVKTAPAAEKVKVSFIRDGKKMKEKVTFE